MNIAFNKLTKETEKKMRGPSPGEKYDEFKKIFETSYGERSGDDSKQIKSLRDRLAKEGLSEPEIKSNIHYYLERSLWLGFDSGGEKLIYLSRDYALRLYVEFLSEEPIPRIPFVIFLSGLMDSPYEISPFMKKLYTIALSDESVLITGETGTGKEFHAKAIHYLSKRLKEKFLAVNCAGIPESLLESELFGYVKGAFTGAIETKTGILEEVGNGSLFLDEIGDMPQSLQAKVLRVLQSRSFMKVGGKDEIEFKGRVIAATNRDLKKEIKETLPRFRPDLFYRLNVMPIELIPFRNLPEDFRKKAILNKLRHIIYEKSGKPGNYLMMDFLSEPGGFTVYDDGRGNPIEDDDNKYISDEAFQILSDYKFPGNYRELDNIIRRSYILSDYGKIEEPILRQEIKELFDGQAEIMKAQASIDVRKVPLKDIIKYADQIKAAVVREKLETLDYRHSNIKNILKDEGITDLKEYQNIRSKIERILGKGVLKKIKDNAGHY